MRPPDGPVFGPKVPTVLILSTTAFGPKIRDWSLSSSTPHGGAEITTRPSQPCAALYMDVYFEGVCVTAVILAPGACGREGQSAGSGTISARSAGSAGSGGVGKSMVWLKPNDTFGRKKSPCGSGKNNSGLLGGKKSPCGSGKNNSGFLFGTAVPISHKNAYISHKNA